MRSFTLLLLLLCGLPLCANIRYIDITKISGNEKYVSEFRFIKENEAYYNAWTNDWKYKTPKAEYIKRLEQDYGLFSGLANKNAETFLLLGDIAHYLYNLDETSFFGTALNNYSSAIKAGPQDYRGYWFRGQHYALSNEQELSVHAFLKAEKMLPNPPPADFWDDYAYAMNLASMPVHCIYAMDKSKQLTGKPSALEAQLGDVIRKRIEKTDADKAYKREEIWSAFKEDDKIVYTCKPLGMKVTLDSSWNVSAYDYDRHQGILVIKPDPIKNAAGKSINYTIAVIAKVADDGDQLENFITPFISKYESRTAIAFPGRYKNMIAYEIRDSKMYSDIGGAHMYMIGVERDAPAYPGFLLESPYNIPKSTDGSSLGFYSPKPAKARFSGKIFYAILLDSCGDIHEASAAIFRHFFEEELVIE